MKQTVLLLLGCLGSIVPAHADLTILETVEGAGAGSTVTVKVKGSKLRVDAGPGVATIFDAGTGEMLQVLKAQKSVIRFSGEKMKVMSQWMGAQQDKVGPAGKGSIVATGKTEKINGYDAEEFTTETPTFRASYWVAKNYPDAAAILQQLRSIKPPNWDFAKMGIPDFADLPGLPIRTVISFGETRTTSTITSINQQPVDDAEFSVPADFKEVKMPDIGKMLDRNIKERPGTGPSRPE